MEDKESLLESIRPAAVLKAITPEAKRATIRKCLGHGIIGIWDFPFRIGRESRVKEIDGLLVVYEREKKSNEKPNNDFYLVDHEKLLHISREHFEIEKNENSYFLRDRDSTCGTMVNDVILHKKTQYCVHELKDGDIITVGLNDSPYKFQFIVF